MPFRFSLETTIKFIQMSRTGTCIAMMVHMLSRASVLEIVLEYWIGGNSGLVDHLCVGCAATVAVEMQVVELGDPAGIHVQ